MAHFPISIDFAFYAPKAEEEAIWLQDVNGRVQYT